MLMSFEHYFNIFKPLVYGFSASCERAYINDIIFSSESTTPGVILKYYLSVFSVNKEKKNQKKKTECGSNDI